MRSEWATPMDKENGLISHNDQADAGEARESCTQN